MPKYLTLPDGNSLEVPDNVSYDQALAKAKEHFPKLYGMPGPDSGLFSALGAGVKSGLGSTVQGIGETTGLPALADYGKRLEESAAKTYQPTSEQDIAAARAKGFLPEAGAYLSKYITEPVGEAVGNIAGRYGLPTLAGMGAAAAAPEVGLASTLGFAAANAPIHIGENIAAQKKLGQAPDYTAAIAAGIGQTAIDSLAGAIFNAPLKGILGKTAQEQAMALAPEVLAGKLTAEEASKQVGSTLRNIAQGTAQNAVVGTGMMVGNEALTRAATGQSLTSPEAQEAYLQNAKMGVGMSPLFGALHGMGARGDAETLLKKAAAEGEEARAKLNQKTELDQDHPEYIQKIKNDYESAWEKYTQMRDALGKAPGKDEPPHLAIEHQEQKDAVAEQKKIVEDLAPEYHRVQKLLKTEEEPPKLLGYTPTPKQLPGMETLEGAKRNVLDLVDEHKQMLEKKAEIEQRMHNAAPEEFADLHNAYEGLNHRINFAEQSIRDAGGVLSEPSDFEALAKKQVDTVDKKIKIATDAYNKAKDPEIGNFEGARKQAEKLQKLQKEKQDLLDLHDQQRLQLAKQATGKGETLPLFSEKETPPGVAQTPEDAVSFDQPTAEQPTKPDKSQRVLFHGQNYKDTALRNQTEADRIAATPEGQTAPLFNEKEAPIPKDAIAPTETETAPEIAPRKTSGQQEMFGPKGEVIPTKENVTPETISQAAETPEMRAMAHAEGIKTPEHKAFMKERNQQIADLRQSGDINGANALRAQTTFEGYNKAVELGKASSKYQDRVVKTAAKLETESNKQPKKGATKKQDEDLYGATPTSEGRTALSSENQERLANKDIVGTLQDLAKNSKSPLIRDSAARLAKLVGDTKIQIVSELKLDGKSVPALYDPKTNTIKFHTEGLSEEDLIHEAEHAATIKNLKAPNSELTKKQIGARNEIFNIYSRLKNTKVLEGEYAAETPEEFVAEVRSNQGLRDKLQGLKWSDGNMLQRLFTAFKRLIGLAPKDVLEAADRHIQALETESQKVKAPEAGSIFRNKAEYGTDNPLSRLTQKVIAQKPTLKDKMSNVSALAAEMEAVDMRAALRKAITIGAKEINNPNLATQVISHIIRGDDKVQMAMSVLGKGPLEIYTDEKGLKGVQSSNKNSGTDVFKAISAIPEGNAQGKTDMATAYLVAVRALNKGLKKLDLGELGLSEKDLQDTMAYVDSRPAMKAALEDVRTKYNAYNEGQIKFLADTGAITKKAAADLMRDKDYIPFYRVGADGKAELIFNDNVMIKVGDIKNQPYLHALKGGETKILPLDQSMLQNTLLLTDKGLTNLTQKSIAYAFQEIGNARPNGGKNEMLVHTGKGPADKNVLRFTQEPDPKNPADTGDRWIKINTAGTVMEGVPDAMIMKSIEGTALSLPAYLKLAGDASDLLRSGVTRTPLYLAHQLLRDPIAAVATGGVDKNPLMAVLAAGKNFIQMQRGKSEVGAELIRKGILHSQIFKGDSSDISKYALQLASGKDQNAIQWLVSKADKMALDADASTRALVYQNAREKGMSEVEAEVAAREIVNYQKRGLSASVQHTNRMIPFMNGQIQALNSFAKAARGNMPFNDQLNIKKKFYNTALTLAGSGLAYGFALSDNPYYKNATLQDKYSNMFVFLPGLEEPIKIPVPYEVGYFFSLGAAAADAINGTAETKDQAGALAKLFSSSIPGYSSKGVPQVIKPIAEAALNLDLNYMQPLESARLQKLDPEQRITANTTELAKQMSHLVGGVISPIKLEHIVKGYLGQLPLAAAGAANDLFKPGTEKPAARITEAPLIGSAFQKKFGGGDENIAYEEAQDAIKAQNTFNTMVKEGRGQEAREYMLANKDRLMLAKLATQFQNTMAQFAAQTRIIQNSPHLTADQKRERLDRIDEAKQKLSANFRKATSRV